MNLTTENILLIGSILLLLSILAGKTTYRFGIPILIFFLAIGILAGSEGIGGIYFDNPKTAQFIGIIALNFILFSGGLDTDWKSIKPVFWQGFALSTLGVLVTALSVGFFIWAVTDFTIFEGLLLGSIVSSTDSTAVFSILRSRKLALKHNLRPTLELESGSNDPMAYVLTIAFTGLIINEEAGLISVLPLFFKQIIIGGLLGLIFGRVGKFIINKINIEIEGLYIVLVIALALFCFSATDFLSGNGFLAIYLCALYLGNQDLIHKKKILKSFDSFAWLMQIVLFLTLGLLVFPSRIVPVIGIGLLISAFLILAARPLGTILSLLFFRMQNRSRLFIAWAGLRGAVPIVFATYPLIAGVEKSPMIFNIVFFISLTSVLLQGTTLALMAKWLRLTVPEKVKQKTLADKELTESVKSKLTEITIPVDSVVVGKALVDIGFPKTALISIIQRAGKYLTPHGATILEEKDKLYIISENEAVLKEVYHCLHLGVLGEESTLPLMEKD